MPGTDGITDTCLKYRAGNFVEQNMRDAEAVLKEADRLIAARAG
jgi:hypothetical protein